ncbi:hypothetical protein SAMN05444157_1916 [Frankineae bacterium MT45]|nr:hypothetical protein SAMN05444157_1916 [Frankineae bacterium MT45]
MLIDCRTCSIRATGCADCVITVLLASPPIDAEFEPDLAGSVAVVEFDPQEHSALAALADGGLIPPLRMSRDEEDGLASPEPDVSRRAARGNRQGLNVAPARCRRVG